MLKLKFTQKAFSCSFRPVLFGGVLGLAFCSSMAIANDGENQNTVPKSEACPENFSDIKVPRDGKLCQVFATDFPASMIFFVPQTPESVVEYYQQNQQSLVSVRKVKNRTMLQSEDKSTTVIISADGKGTQVDILVTQAPENA